MKRKLTMLCAVLLCLGSMVPTANAVGVSIEVGDRPYYVHGPYYYVGPTRYVWVPGHWRWRHHHRVWIHGYYVVR
jgi:WXXGXW repeat (2 copies)